MGFCKEASIGDIENQEYVLTPGNYVGNADAVDDNEPFEDKMSRLTTELYSLFDEASEIEEVIRHNMKALGY